MNLGPGSFWWEYKKNWPAKQAQQGTPLSLKFLVRFAYFWALAQLIIHDFIPLKSLLSGYSTTHQLSITNSASTQNKLTRNFIITGARTLRRSLKYIVQVFKVDLTAPSLIKESQSLAIFFLAEAALLRYNWPVRYKIQCKYYNTVEQLPNFQNKPFLKFEIGLQDIVGAALLILTVTARSTVCFCVTSLVCTMWAKRLNNPCIYSVKLIRSLSSITSFK